MSEQFLLLEGREYDKLVQEAKIKFNTEEKYLDIKIIENKKSLFGSYYKLKISKKDVLFTKIEESIQKLEVITSSEDDPYIEFKFKNDGVYLIANQYTNQEEILVRANIKKIQDIDKNIIKDYFTNNQFMKEIKVAGIQEENKIDSICTIKVTKDAMQAFAFITPPYGGIDITEEIINQSLQERKVSFGILDEAIKDIVKNRIYNEDVLISQGIVPIDGKNGELLFDFDISKEKKVTIQDNGNIDYHELSLICNVKKGQALVRLKEHTEGITGKNVLGLEVPAKNGKKVYLPKGKNVEISEDNTTLIASIDGEVSYIDDKVSISSVHEVRTDVDNSVGNIRFNGKVIVKGNVLTGFLIEAEDDVEVYGVVEGARITTKGNIILHRGIQGMNKGELYCDGDLVAKFIENSKVEVKGNIISDAIMHSNVMCGKKLEVKGKKGLIVGGEYKVCEEIKAKVIGSPMSTITEIEVGTNPELRKKYELIKKEICDISNNLQKASQAVDLLTKISKTNELPHDKKVLLSKSIQLKLQLSNKLEQLKTQLLELEVYLEEITNGKIKAYDIVYPGTRVTIGSSKMYVKDVIKHTILYRSNAEIKIGTYEE